MRVYDHRLPLIFMHIPKTGGNAVKDCLIRWFGQERFIQPYREQLESLEEDPRMKSGPVVLGGHWPTHKRTLERIWPNHDTRQIFTVLRDPFSVVKSMYTYGLQMRGDTRAKRSGSFDAYLDGIYNKRVGLSCFSYLPRRRDSETLAEYAGQFMLLGITEDLQSSLGHLAEIVGKRAPDTVKYFNRSVLKPDDVTDERREEIEALFPEEVEFYRSVKSALEKGQPLGWAKSGAVS